MHHNRAQGLRTGISIVTIGVIGYITDRCTTGQGIVIGIAESVFVIVGIPGIDRKDRIEEGGIRVIPRIVDRDGIDFVDGSYIEWRTIN